MTWADHSIHPKPPAADAEKLDWTEPLAQSHRIRVRRHTCGCQELSYELCASSGVMFIRRTTQTSDKTTIHETERWLAKRAGEVWTLLLAGQAH